MKSKDLKKSVPDKKASLGNVLNENKKIKKTIKRAAGELTSVNEVLKQRGKVKVPVQTIQEAITQNVDVENKLAKAANDLDQVNIKLTRQVAEQVITESELAEVRDDLSRSKAKEQEIRKFAFQDAGTGLPNRALFEELLLQGVEQAKRHGWKLAVMFIDVDDFKSINDSYGHALGDKVMLMVANRLQASIRSEDTVSRWGGDEFMALLLEVRQEADMVQLAEKMVEQVARAWEFNGIVFSLSVSIGIAIYPADGDTADILFRNSDRAMYKAKRTDKRVMLFQESILD